MYFNFFIIYFFLNDIMCAYLVRRLMITSIKSYVSSNVESFDFNNLMMKFINTSSYNEFNKFMYYISSYFLCIACLFFWQVKHILIYASIFCLIYKN